MHRRIQGNPQMTKTLEDVRALVFDVFGTVVDWRSSVIAELECLGQTRKLSRNWAEFADFWRQGYGDGMRKINDDADSWITVDVIHRRKLDQLLRQFEVPGLKEDEIDHLNRIWHRLQSMARIGRGADQAKGPLHRVDVVERRRWSAR